MKSKKHHKRIYEKRSITNISETFNGKKINFVKKKPVPASVPVPAIKNAIKFVSNNKNNRIANSQTKNPYTTIQTYDMSSAFEQPSLDNVYSSVKAGQVIEYKEYFASETMKRKNDDWEQTNKYPKMETFSSVSNSNYNINNDYMNNNNNYNNNYINNSYVPPVYSNNQAYQQNANSFGDYNQSTNQNFNYDMFSNLAMLQYSNAFAAAKKNTK